MPHYKSQDRGYEVRQRHRAVNTLMQLKCLPVKLPGGETEKITGSQWHKSFVYRTVEAKPGWHAVNAKTCFQSNHSRIHRQIRLLTPLLGVGEGGLYQNKFICFPTSNRTLLTYTFPVLKFVISDSFCKSSNLLCFHLLYE